MNGENGSNVVVMAVAVLQHATGGAVQAALKRVLALSSTMCNDVEMVVSRLRASQRCVMDPRAFCRVITANMPVLPLQARRLRVNVPAFEAAFAPQGRYLASTGAVGVGVSGAGHIQQTRRVEQQEEQENVQYLILSRRPSNYERYNRNNGHSERQVSWPRK